MRPINAFTRELLPADPVPKPPPAIRRELSLLQSPVIGSVKLAATLHPESAPSVAAQLAAFLLPLRFSWDLGLSPRPPLPPRSLLGTLNHQHNRQPRLLPPAAQSATTALGWLTGCESNITIDLVQGINQPQH